MTTAKRHVPVARLGALERAVMEALWDLTGPRTGHSDATARQVVERLSPSRTLAYTTVLTVLDRLERKGLVRRLREGRAHRYVPVATREAYAAELMLEALGRASDRDAALMRFVDAVSPEEAEALRRALLGEGSDRPEARP
ncbi:MAG TPA: BlaI/MecI/CopY family transcriptional regulator [Actinomycetes bacterium]|jgi:predicted transcriptional regulator|nr:BlaI/MecI/CopY family transcriptional regulator [Actinomycetes bacterium]